MVQLAPWAAMSVHAYITFIDILGQRGVPAEAISLGLQKTVVQDIVLAVLRYERECREPPELRQRLRAFIRKHSPWTAGLGS